MHKSLTLFLIFHLISVAFYLLFIAIAVVTCIIIKEYKKFFLPIFLGLLISSRIPFWINDQKSVLSKHLIFLGLITILSVYLLSIKTKRIINLNLLKCIQYIAYITIAFFLSYSSGPLESAIGFSTAWHHWSAYIAPSELLLSGAAIFHDFPAQYWLGPTAFIAFFCDDNCWTNTYFIFSTTLFIFSLCIFFVLFNQFKPQNWYTASGILLVTLLSCFFYTGYPPILMSPLVIPSVSGIRFLPATLLFVYLYFCQTNGSKIQFLGGHFLWLIGLLWSPESAFYCTFIWFPYYLYLKDNNQTTYEKIIYITQTSLKFIAALTLISFIFLGIYFSVYRKLPSLYGFFAYMINPPGPLPISWNETIWLFLTGIFVLINSMIKVFKNSDIKNFKRGFLILLINYAVFSYFLGRSHSNNILVLMPFLSMTYIYAAVHNESKIYKIFSITIIASLIANLVFFGWDSFVEGNKSKSLSELFNAKKFTESTNFSNKNAVERTIKQGNITQEGSSDLGKLIFRIQELNEPFTIINPSMVFNASMKNGDNKSWAAINNIAIYKYMPSHYRRVFLSNTAKFNHEPGWIIIDKKINAEEWTADFDSTYKRTGSIDSKNYYAIRYSPNK
jgi:hypothetical protein